MDLKIQVLKSKEDNLMVYFLYNPKFVEKIKTIKRHRWHPEEKYWSFPSSNGVQSKPEKNLSTLNITLRVNL
jgi:hypothetical protein